MLPTKFRFIWPSGFGGEDLKKLANQKQELPVAAMLVYRSGQNEQSLEDLPQMLPTNVSQFSNIFRVQGTSKPYLVSTDFAVHKKIFAQISPKV